jgi:RNA polymerase sigma-70 factor (ECF subfamily)
MRRALVKFFNRKCGNRAEAEDLAQDVLVRSLPRVDWRSPEQTQGYVFRAAINRWRDRNRRALTRGHLVDWDDAAPFALDEGISPERVLIIQEELQLVTRALRAMNERTRDVFLLVRLENMKQAEIAERLGISVSAVEKHLAKALAQVARAMNPVD